MIALALFGCAEPPPSVLLVTLDTTRADHLGCYGYAGAHTPTLDKLAADGTRYARAYSSCPLTIPSHATMLTGRYPPAHGVRDNGDFILGEEETTLSERLAGAGWDTAAFTAAFPTQARWGLHQGFRVYHDRLDRLPTELDWRDQRTADEVVDDALATLPTLGDPAFVWVHLFDAHWPYRPQPDFPGAPSAYDGEIAFADAQGARLIEAWDARYPRSIVIVTADHGEGLGDGGERTHGFLLHDGTLHVPLIVRGEGFPAAVVDDPVGLVDIAPTVLAALGLPPLPDAQGRDLRAGGSDTVYSEARTARYHLGLSSLYAETGVDGRYTEGAWGAWYPADGTRVAVTPEGAAPVEPRRASLAEIRAAIGENHAPEAALDDETLAMLEALGYAGGGSPQAPEGTVDPRDVIDLLPLTWEVPDALREGRLAWADQAITRLEAELHGAVGARRLRAQWFARTGRLDDAYETFTALYLELPEGGAAVRLGEMAASVGDFVEAERWYAEAISRAPHSPEAMAGQVDALAALGDTAGAEVLADRYLAIFPDHAQLLLTRARLRAEAGYTAEALADTRFAIGRLATSADAQRRAAGVLWLAGEPEEALDRYADALRLAPWNPRIRLLYGEALLDVGRAAEALRVARGGGAATEELRVRAEQGVEEQRRRRLP